MGQAIVLGVSSTAVTGPMDRAPVTVIAITGPPGSGKTTLAEALACRLGDAAVLTMDHYQSMTQMPIEEVEHWSARGADLDELPVGPLAEHLASLKRGRSVVDPATGAEIAPRRYIVFDTHFGRAHKSTGGLIDQLVWLDTPTDIALARNLRGFLQPLLGPCTPVESRDRLHWIDRYLDHYVRVVSALLHMQAARIRPGADLLIRLPCSTSDAVDEVCHLLAAAGC